MATALRGRVLSKREQQAVTQRKLSVRLATVGAVSNLSALSSSLDGKTIVAGDRVLVWHSSSPDGTITASTAYCGIYYCTLVAAGLAMMVRADDFDSNDKVNCGADVFVEEGTVWGGHTFRLTTANPIALNTTALTFADQGGSTGTTGATRLLVCDEAGGLVAGDILYEADWSTTYLCPKVKKADANSATPAARVPQWVCPATVANGVPFLGQKRLYMTGLNTNAATSAGENIYLSTTAGGYLLNASKPTGDSSAWRIGNVGVKSATVGTLQIDLDAAALEAIGTTSIQADTIVPADVDLTAAFNWTGAHTFDPGATPLTAIQLLKPATGAQVDSHDIQQQGASNDGAAHTTDWKEFVDITSNAGASTKKFQSRIDAAGFVDKFSISDQGAATLTSPTGVQPTIAAAGADANHNVVLTPKGTGTLVLKGDGAQTSMTIAPDSSGATVDLKLSPKGAGGVVDVDTSIIDNVTDPTANDHAATKQYVDKDVFFGTGLDGAAAFDCDAGSAVTGTSNAQPGGAGTTRIYTALRDLHFTNATFDTTTGPIWFNLAGFRLFVNGTLTTTATTTIRNMGSDASGGTGGAGAAARTVGGGTAGGNNTAAGTNATNCLGGVGGAGGAGGQVAGTLGLPLSIASVADARKLLEGMPTMISGVAGTTQLTGGSGGGGGADAGGTGGGGGGGGGHAFVAAKICVGAGTISADGGAGANGVGANATGGGGGGGGLAELITTDAGAITLTAAGGALGTDVVGGPTAVAGASGSTLTLTV